MESLNRRRVILHVTSFDVAAPLVACIQGGCVTHLVIGMFHLGHDGAQAASSTCIRLNDRAPEEASFDALWRFAPAIRSADVKLLGSFGGSGFDDFRFLFSNYGTCYRLLCDMLRRYDLDGLDLHIEEWDVTTAEVVRLVSDLRADFGDRAGGFLITSTPVASALTGGGSASGGVDYTALVGMFDWYNVQFFNGWGDLAAGSAAAPPNYLPDYAGVVAACGSTCAERLVASVLTCPGAGYGHIDLAVLTPIIADLASAHAGFGGVGGWTFQHALDATGNVNPAGWAAALQNAMNRP